MDLSDLNSATQTYLVKRFHNTVAYHTSKGREVTLTLAEYIELLDKSKLLSFINKARMRWLESGSKRRFKLPYVLGWRSKAAFAGKLVAKHTMAWATHQRSKETGSVKLNTKHSEQTKKRISEAKKGRPIKGHPHVQDPERDRKISIKLTGRVQSESQKAARRLTWMLKRTAAAQGQAHANA